MRDQFKENIFRINSNLTLLTEDNLLIHVDLLALKDTQLIHPTGEYVFKMLKVYKEWTE